MAEFDRQAAIAWLNSLGVRGSAIVAMLEADEQAMRAAWDGWGRVYSAPDDCDDCAAVESFDPASGVCSLHGGRGDALWQGMRLIADRIVRCKCSHQVLEHNDDESTHCLVKGCDCRALRTQEASR